MAKTEAMVIENPDAPVEKEVLAQAIVDISSSMKKLLRSGINQRGVIALLRDDTGLGKGTIETVLNSLDALARRYTK